MQGLLSFNSDNDSLWPTVKIIRSWQVHAEDAKDWVHVNKRFLTLWWGNLLKVNPSKVKSHLMKFLLSPFNSLFHLMILFVLHHCLKQSHNIFLYMNADLLTNPFLCIHNISSVFSILFKKSIGDLTSFNIICPSPDDGSLEPKHYSIDFLLH